MDRALYVTASGMLAELSRQDRIAADIANASTPGYKRETATQRSFGDLLVSNEAGLPLGRASTGVVETTPVVDLTQGALQDTGEPLDLALDGPGFFSIKTAAGVRYTRDGQFRLDPSGTITTASGEIVLGSDGNPLTPGGKGRLTITSDGTVIAGKTTVGKIAVTSLQTPVKVETGVFTGTPAGTPRNTSVRQGTLEGSNVGSTEAMVEMMLSLRSFEADQRVLHTIDETLGKGISAGAVNG